MATYLQGVTDYIPQVQPWAPNFNFYQNAFDRKQQKFDQGWNKLNTVYNSILNAPMMREDNNLNRDEFFKNIKTQIDQMAGMDLSLQQNVSAATQVFKPFYENEEIVHDIGYTKRYSDEMQKAEYLKNCTDKECEDKYWSGGVRALRYKAEDFVNANAEDALKMQAPSYVPNMNFMKMAVKATKELDLKMEYDHKEGRYMVTTRGGEQAKKPLMNFLMATFADDSNLKDFYKTKAFLLGKENPEKSINSYEYSMMQSKAETQEELDKMVKEKANEISYNKAGKVLKQTKNKKSSQLSSLERKRKIFENAMLNNGIVKGSPGESKFRELLELEKDAKLDQEKINDMVDEINSRPYRDDEGKIISQDVIDNTVAQAMMMRDMGLAAETIAYKDYKVTRKADPYEMVKYKEGFKNQRAMMAQISKNERAFEKNLISEAKTHKELLIKAGHLDLISGKPKHKSKDQSMQKIDGGGMSVGDPLDKKALYDKMKKDGTYQGKKHFEAYFEHLNSGELDNGEWLNSPSESSYNNGNGETGARQHQMYQPASKLRATSKSKSKTSSSSYNNKIDELAENIQNKIESTAGASIVSQGVPQPQFTDADDEKTGAVTTNNITGDERIATVIADGSSSNKIKTVVDDVVQNLAGMTNIWKKIGGDIQEKWVKDRFASMLTIASDEEDSDYLPVLETFVRLGDMMHNLNYYGGEQQNVWSEGAQANVSTGSVMDFLTKKQKEIFKKWPTSSNSENNNSIWYKEALNEIDMGDLIAAAGGTGELWKLMSNNSHKVMTESYQSGDMIDRQEVQLIEDDQYTSLANREQDIAAYDFIKSNIDSRGGIENQTLYPDGHPDLVFYNNFSANPLAPLNDIEKEQIKSKEWYENQPTWDNGLSELGLDNTMPWLIKKNIGELHLIQLADQNLKAAALSKDGFKNQMNNAFKTYKSTMNSESHIEKNWSGWSKSLGGGKETPYSYIDRFVASNIWNDKANDGWGGLRSLGGIIQKASERGSQTHNFWEDWFDNPTDMFQGNSETIFELESTFLGGGEFRIEGLINMLEDSELVGALDVYFEDEFYQDMIEENGTTMETSPYDSGSSSSANLKYLLNNPETTFERNGSDLKIGHPTFLTYDVTIDLDDYEVSRGFENMYKGIQEQIGGIRRNFMNTASNTPSGEDYSVLPSNFYSDAKSNFTFVSPALTNIDVNAGDKSVAREEMMPLIKDLYENGVDQDLREYNVGPLQKYQQGDPEYLKMISNTFTNNYEKNKDSKKNPGFSARIDPTFNDLNLSRVIIKLDAGTSQKWLKDTDLMDYTYKKDKQNDDTKEKDWFYIVNGKRQSETPELTYYIANSNSELIRKMKPNAQNVLLGLSRGGKYVDDIFWDEFKGKTEYKKDGDNIIATRYTGIWDYEVKDYVPTPITPVTYPLVGTDWNFVFKKELDAYMANPGDNMYRREQEEIAYSLKELEKPDNENKALKEYKGNNSMLSKDFKFIK
jgi:hypothetical protein